MITKNKWQQLRIKMHALNISEDDIDEKFIIGTGNGGQKLQKTASCVTLKHHPTGILIKCQESRLRDSNRFFARRRLCEKIEHIIFKEKSEKQKQIAKIRQQKKRRSRRAKQKILSDKKHQSIQKNLRRKPNKNDH